MSVEMFRVTRENDQGVSLVELLVYLALMVVVASILGSLLINFLNLQKRIVNSTTASQQAQSIAQALEVSVRNATAVSLTQVGSGDQMVTVRSSRTDSPGAWDCIAFYYSAAKDGSIRYHRSSSAIGVPVPSDLASWVLLGQGIKPTLPEGFFSLTGTRLKFAFQSQVVTSPATNIDSVVTARGGPWVSAPCF